MKAPDGTLCCSIHGFRPAAAGVRLNQSTLASRPTPRVEQLQPALSAQSLKPRVVLGRMSALDIRSMAPALEAQRLGILVRDDVERDACPDTAAAHRCDRAANSADCG